MGLGPVSGPAEARALALVRVVAGALAGLGPRPGAGRQEAGPAPVCGSGPYPGQSPGPNGRALALARALAWPLSWPRHWSCLLP